MKINQISSKTIITATISILLILPQLLTMTETLHAQSNEYTYAITVIHVRYHGEDSYGTLKLKIPRYIMVDRDNIIEAYFERSGYSNNVIVIFTIGARISTINGDKEYSLQTVSFSLRGDASQQALVKFNIPRELYEQSIDKKVIVFIKGVTPTADFWDSTFDRCYIDENIPATAYLVYGVPQPQLVVRGLGLGYVNMSLGEVRSISIDVTSMYAPIIVRGVDVSAPQFVAVFVNTPLPLNVGVNETIPIVIAVDGVQSGAGVMGIAIRYYTGVDERYISVYIPIVVEEKHVFDLIDQYRYKLQQLRQEVEYLETQLNIKTSNIDDLMQRLTTISNTLANLGQQYSEALNKIGIALSKISNLNNSVMGLQQQFSQINIELSSQRSSIETLKQNISSLSLQVQQAIQRINQIEKATDNLNNSVKTLKSYIDEQNTLIKELQQSMDRSSIWILGITVISIAALILVIRIGRRT